MANNLVCELKENSHVNNEIFTIGIAWGGLAPKAGQFFMLKPLRSSLFLARPLSVFEWQPEQKMLRFLVARRGKGTNELSQVKLGEKIEITGPFGNAWADFLPANNKSIALVSGGVGIAPLAALVAEKPEVDFHFYAGFKNSFNDKTEEAAILGSAYKAKRFIISAEYGMSVLKGRIVDYFDNDPNIYSAVFACGPGAMLNAIKAKCNKAGLPCFISLERRMACGSGACLGCTVQCIKGNRRCCTDGPIFAAEELRFDE